jgi:cobalt/nickel transport system ATP-binding protein
MALALEKNIAAVARVIETTVTNERWARSGGLLQSLDVRAKIAALPLLMLLCALTKSIPVLLALYAVSLVLAGLSGIGAIAFIKRVWIFIPLFTGVIAIPALFMTPGQRIAAVGPLTITREGLTTAVFLIMRVSTSVSFALLLVLTTRWNDLTRALGDLRVPHVLVSLLAISYRYFILLLRTLIELLAARTSRVISALPYRTELAFLSRSTGFIFVKSLHLAEGVQMAMISRGGDPMDHRAAEDTPAANHEDSSAGRRHGAARGSASGATGDTRPAFALRDVSYAYPDGTTGLRIASLRIHAGICTIILGPNGSGKSTLLKLLDGLIFPQSGEIKAFGEVITENRLRGREFRRFFRSRVGLVFQNPDIQCFSPTVRDELAFGPVQKGLGGEALEHVIEDAMKLLGIDKLGDRYPYRLSGGEKKRVAIGSVLTVDPEIYLMDEPTASLDPATEGVLIDILAELTERRKTLVIATQDLLLARHIGERAVILGCDRSVAASGTVSDVLGDGATLERTGLIHAHRTPHRTAAAALRHSHYTEKENR